MTNKEQSRIREKIVRFCQKAFVFNKQGKFLAMRRTKTAPTNPLKWDLPGGSVDFGENPLKSILREIKEETNLRVRHIIPFDVEGHVNNQDSYNITLAYKGIITGGKISISWEHDLYQWVTVDEFLKLKTTKKLRMFARNLVSLD